MGTSLTPVRFPAFGLSGLQRLNTMLDQVFRDWPFAEPGAALTSAWLPPVDVFEDKDSVKIVAEVPGVNPKDIEVSIENNMLTIRGEKQQVGEERTERVHRYERSYGRFERSFALPATVDPDRIEANYDAGVLTITVQKAEKAKPRQIEIRGTTNQQAVSAGTSSQGQRAGASQSGRRS